jgi:very-short-patch-repair endonuclease
MTRNYEAEFLQAFDDLGRQVWDCAGGGFLPEGSWDVAYQYKPGDLRYPDTKRLAQFTLDFCVPEVKAALEFDGFFSAAHGVGGHRNWGGFHRDRRKDRLLTRHGWRVYRFGPGDVKNYGAVVKAVKQFLELVEWIKATQ